MPWRSPSASRCSKAAGRPISWRCRWTLPLGCCSLAGSRAIAPTPTVRFAKHSTSGRGLDRFRRIVEFQGGDPRAIDDVARLPSVAGYQAVVAPRAGYVTRLDAALVGRASAALGAGRDRTDDPIDPAVGISVLAKPGTQVARGDPVLALHYRSPDRLNAALALATEAIGLGDSPPPTQSTIVGQVN